MAQEPNSRATGCLRAVAALRYRNYRLFFGGQSVSLIGTWMQRLAGWWLVYRVAGGSDSHCALVLGVYGFVTQIPWVPVAPWAGVWIDRLDKQRVLIWAQAAAMFQALALAGLVFTGTANLWNVFALGILLTLINTVDMPARQSFVVDMIENKEDLPNAIALNSFMVNGAKVIGPSIAGVLIGALGEGYCFLINGLSYIGVIWAIWAMRVKPRADRPARGRAREEFREGLRYVRNHVPIRTLLLMLCAMGFLGVSYADMLPVVVRQVFGNKAFVYGLLRAAPGIGAMFGGAWLATRNSAGGLARVVPIAAAVFGLALATFALSTSLALALSLLSVSGLGLIVYMASSNTIVQTAVEDDKRGRVMSLYAIAMQGPLPWGSLMAGGLTAALGVRTTFLILGICCVLCAGVFALRLPAWGDAGRLFTSKHEPYPQLDEPPSLT